MTETAAERILAAVQQILVTDGIEEVSIRNVANVAEVSVGAVQHHHRSKSELLVAAMDRVSEDFMKRVASATDPSATPFTNLTAVCHILGGVDDQSRVASVIWLAYASKAATSEIVARAHQEAWKVLEGGLTTLLQQVNSGMTIDDAASLMAILDGIAIARVTETDRMSSDRARRLIDAFLQRCAP